MYEIAVSALEHEAKRVQGLPIRGRVSNVVGMAVETAGPPASLGDECIIRSRKGARNRRAEVVGFRNGHNLLMPWEGLEGISHGDEVLNRNEPPTAPVGLGVLGRMIDPLGRPADGKGPLAGDVLWTPMVDQSPPPSVRPPISEVFPTGVRAIDSFCTVGEGQRMGIFSGSGVGKSSLMGMIARHGEANVRVIALIGERSREVREFVEHELGEEALKNSVVVVATADQPAIARIKAVFLANTIAAFFRDMGLHVLLMVDSLTRLAMAQRELGLAIGEPPATRGYPPSVFAVIPKALEQAGRTNKGAITGFYTVLTDGDDWNDPVSDCARSILDGHLLLSRELASEHHYPAIDVMSSLSRLQSSLINEEQDMLIAQMRHVLAVNSQYRELIEIGAYTPGSNPQLDEALSLQGPLNQFLQQRVEEKGTMEESFQHLRSLLNGGGNE